MWRDPVAENGTRPEPAATQTGPVLAGLTAAEVPWLALAAAEGGRPDPGLTGGGDTAVIDIADSQSPPVTLNPLEPETGYPVQAHADRLAGLLEAAFGLTDPVAAALRSGLRRAYAECGWDLLTGLAPPGGRPPPAVPSFGHLGRAVLAAADDLGYDPALRATVRGFLQARLEPLWTGPAGRFLEGGHPVDSAALLAGNTLFIIGGPADDEALFFLAGVPLIRLAERLSLADGSYPARARRLCPDHQSGGPGPRLAVVLAGPVARPAQPPAAAWLTRLLADLRARGVQVIATPAASDHPLPATPASAPEIPARLLNGRRSAACGALCRRSGPCTGYQIHAASLLAGGDEQVWLRLWLRTLLLAFLTGRPVPRVPPGLRSAWRALGPRERDCLLATVLEAIGIGPQARLNHVARAMGIGARGAEPGWLEVVLSWPDRIIGQALDPDLEQTATG